MITTSPKETIAWAKKWAKTLKPGAILALVGDLGSGKTTFIKGIALGLGLKNPDEVKSPTFALMHVYPARTPIYHFDLYRLDDDKAIRSMGFEDFIHDANAISCVEWADKGEKFLPEKTIHIQFEVVDPSRRRIRILKTR